MLSFSKRFQEVMTRVLDAEQSAVATVMARSHPFVDSLKARPDVALHEVTTLLRHDREWDEWTPA